MSNITPLRQTKDITELTKNLEIILRELQIPLLYGILLENQKLEVGKTNTINHKLRKRVTGYIIVRKNSECDIWEESSSSTSLNLNTNQDVTVSIWIF